MQVRHLYNANGNPAMNQFVISHNWETFFQSYDSLIAKVDSNGKLYVTPYWDYSKTTMKHLWLFLKDYGWGSIASAKDMRKALKNGSVILAEGFTL